MRLHDWELRLLAYPDYPPVQPFWFWNEQCPTRSLPWYEAYNSTKHDRECEFSKGTLEHVVTSVAAMVMMHKAKFGESTAETVWGFGVTKSPQWSTQERHVPA
jgi:hypothetical protein